jgi:hypothetical protein
MTLERTSPTPSATTTARHAVGQTVEPGPASRRPHAGTDSAHELRVLLPASERWMVAAYGD